MRASGAPRDVQSTLWDREVGQQVIARKHSAGNQQNAVNVMKTNVRQQMHCDCLRYFRGVSFTASIYKGKKIIK